MPGTPKHHIDLSNRVALDGLRQTPGEWVEAGRLAERLGWSYKTVVWALWRLKKLGSIESMVTTKRLKTRNGNQNEYQIHLYRVPGEAVSLSMVAQLGRAAGTMKRRRPSIKVWLCPMCGATKKEPHDPLCRLA